MKIDFSQAEVVGREDDILDLSTGEFVPSPVAAYKQVSGVNPDEVAEARKIGKKLDTNPKYVSDNITEARHAAAQPDWEAVKKDAPVLHEMASDPAFAALVQDDYDHLTMLEQAFQEKPELTFSRLGQRMLGEFKQSVADAAKSNAAQWEKYDDLTDGGQQKNALRSLSRNDRLTFDRLHAEAISSGESPAMAQSIALSKVKEESYGYWNSVAENPELQIPEELRRESSGVIEDLAGAMSGSAIGMALAVANPVAGTSYFFNQIYGSKYRELIGNGVDPQKAAEAAFVSALGQAPLESAGALLQLKVVKNVFVSAGKRLGLTITGETAAKEVGAKGIAGIGGDLLKAMGLSAAGEGMEEYLQNFPDLYADTMAEHPESTSAEVTMMFLKEIPDTAVSKESMYSAMIGAMAGATFTGMGGSVGSVIQISRKIKADKFKKKMDEIGKLMTNLEERDREAYEAYVQKVSETNGNSDIYLQGEVLLNAIVESGEDISAWASRMGMTKEQIVEAANQGADVSIQSAKVIASMKEDKVIQATLDDMKVRPDDVAFNQLEVETENDQAAAIRLRELFVDEQLSETHPDQIKVIEDQLIATAEAAGLKGYTKENIRAKVAMLSSSVNTWVERVNETLGLEPDTVEEIGPLDDLSTAAEVDANDIESNAKQAEKLVIDGKQTNATISANKGAHAWYIDAKFSAKEVVATLRKLAAKKQLTEKQTNIATAWMEANRANMLRTAEEVAAGNLDKGDSFTAVVDGEVDNFTVTDTSAGEITLQDGVVKTVDFFDTVEIIGGVAGIKRNVKPRSRKTGKRAVTVDDFFKMFNLTVSPAENIETADGVIIDQDGVQYNQDGIIVTASEAFREWFGDSEVIDEQGEPQNVYHGTPANVEDTFIFDYSKIGTQGRSEGAGFYFTDEKAIAERYVDDGSLLEVYLSIQNPIIMGDQPFGIGVMKNIIAKMVEIEAEENEMDVAGGFLSNFGDISFEGYDSVLDNATDLTVSSSDEVVDQISGFVGAGVDIETVNKAIFEVTGHDGIIAEGFGNKGEHGGAKIYIAFFPEQIKSVNNQGTFGPTSGNIFEQTGVDGFAEFGIVAEGGQGENLEFDFDSIPAESGEDAATQAGGRDVDATGAISVLRLKGQPPLKSNIRAELSQVVSRVQTGTFSIGLDQINSAEDAAHVFASLRKKAKENFLVLGLDENNKPIAIIDVSTGSQSAAIVQPSLAIGPALDLPGVKTLWFAHNHPGGTLEPSKEDVQLTQRLTSLVESAGVGVAGHVIIGAGGNFVGIDYAVGKTRPAVRRGSVPVVDDRLNRNRLGSVTIQSSQAAIDLFGSDEFASRGDGVLFMNSKNIPVGWVGMTVDEMDRLKTSDKETWAGLLTRAASQSGAVAMIIRTAQTESLETGRNVANFAKVLGVRTLDIVFDGDALSAAGRGESFGTSDTFYQSDIGFNSALSKAISTTIFDQKTLTGQQVLTKLKKATATGKVKQSEIDAVGLQDYLELRKADTLTAEEVRAFVDQNGVVVEEVVKGQGSIILKPNEEEPHILEIYRADDPDGEHSGMVGEIIISDKGKQFASEGSGRYGVNVPTLRQRNFENLESAQKYVEENTDLASETKFGDYTLPGGENYREVLLTLPVEKPAPGKELTLSEASDSITDRNAVEIRKDGEFIKNVTSEYGLNEFRGGGYVFHEYRVPVDNSFKSSHFDEPNILAHMRLNDREVGGEKVLFIEEIQSDWSIEGRKKGFKGDSGWTGKVPTTIPRGITGDVIEHGIGGDVDAFITKGQDGEYTSVLYDKNSGSVFASSDKGSLVSAKLFADKYLGVVGDAVPPAPFVTSSAWQSLVLKRVLRMAADGGYQRIAWISGEQTAERYSLDTKIQGIEYKRTGGEKYEVTTRNLDGAEIPGATGSFTLAEIEGVLGKEISKKISDGTGDVFDGTTVLKGNDLKIEAQWARNLYDKAIPKLMQKLTGAKVEDVEMRTGNAPDDVLEEFKDNESFQKANKPTQQSIPITEDFRNNLIDEGQPLFQDKKEPRAVIDMSDLFAGGNTASIGLTPKADLSSFLHETGHFYLEMVRLTNEKYGAYSEEWETIKEYLGVEEGQKITREQHEKWADSWETYLAEGKAPSLQLQSAFDKFKTWLIKIYKSLTNMNADLSDEVRSVMDKIIATDQDIKDAKAVQGLFSVIDDEAIALIGKDSAEVKKMIDSLELSDEEAARALDLHKMRNLKQRRNEYKEQATGEWKELPSTKAIKFGLDNGGISSVEMDTYEAERPGNPGLFRADGMPLQVVADEIGVTKDELLDILAEHQKKTDYIEARVEELEQLHDQSLAAEDAIHTTSLREQMTQESAILSRISQRERVLENRQISNYAKAIVAKMPPKEVRDIRKTISALRRARLKANKHVKNGDYGKAFQENEKARINEQVLVEQVKAKDNLVKIEARWKRILKQVMKNPGNYDPKFRDQISKLAMRFEMTKKEMMVEGDQTLFAFFEGLNNETHDVDGEALDAAIGTYGTYEWLYDEKSRGAWNILTYTHIQEIDDLMKFLRKEGRVDKSEYLLDGETKISDVVDELVTYIEGLGRKSIDEFAAFKKIRKFVRKYDAEQIPLQYIMARMDGFDTSFTGKNMEYLFNPLSEAAGRQHVMLAALRDRLEPLLDELRASANSHPRILRHAPRPASFDNAENADDVQHWTFDKVLAVALNMGNHDNLNKMMNGYGWEYDDVLRVISILTEQDLRNIQNIWDTIDTLWPETAAIHKKLHGFAPKKITSEEFIIPAVEGRAHVVLQGGYYPLKFDSRMSTKQAVQDEKNDIMQSQNNIYPSTKTPQGFTINRQANTGGKPVALSLRVLTDHIQHVTHHVTHAAALTDIDKITKSKGYRTAVKEAFGVDVQKMIRPGLAHIANPKSMGNRLSLDEFLEGERARAAGYILWYNIRVAMKQPYSMFNLIQSLGGMSSLKYIGPAYVDLISQPHKVHEYIQTIHKLSPNMARRSKAIDRELQKADKFGRLRKLTGKETVEEALHKFSDATGPVLIRIMDFVAAYPGWMAAYNKGLDLYDNDIQKAVAFADNHISATQPFDRPIDQSAVRRNKGLARLFTMFTGYTMKFANRRAFYWQGFKVFIKTKGKSGIGPAEFMSHVLLERLAPSLLMTTMLSYTFRGEAPDAEDYALDLLLFQFAGRYVVQDLAAFAFSTHRYSDSVLRTPVETGMKLVGDLGKKLNRAWEDEDALAALSALSESLEYKYKIPIQKTVKKIDKTIEVHN